MKRLSAGVIIVRDTREGRRFLLLRAFNHWDFPKGLVENGETPFEAAVREVCEETTLDDLTGCDVSGAGGIAAGYNACGSLDGVAGLIRE